MFIAIPVGMNYRTERLPWVTFTLIGVNTLIWLVSDICFFSTDGESELWIRQNLWLTPAAFHFYQYFTAMFVHAGILHLLGNMIFLFLFGACVEDLIGRLRFALFYLIGGIAADLVYIAMTPQHFDSEIPMGGASGAISTCMGMYLLLRTGEKIEFKYFFWFFLVYMRAGEFEIPAWVAISFWFGRDLLSALLGMVFSYRGGGVAFGAHVGGFLAGLALIGSTRWRQRQREEKPVLSTLIIDPAKILAASRPPLAPAPAFAPAASETPAIYLHDGEQQTGPFSLTRVQAMLQHGEISRDACYWSEGMEDWQSVVELADHPIG